ncbi:Npc2-like protein [Pochonia chlamydosporia 170]|uniref:Phosphatidylglycerol/phosphatidylinositol transfer protein n=1 Tax=Pochonia chlamydosporia 170 TaxID=1380566 RepID=A0A219AQU6_METCM|nr:Npc2-like protein [Pochonia chlamydosporia 170]OWT43136.1 Npc2-like protein [Pochonia chlamydosporia 170]
MRVSTLSILPGLLSAAKAATFQDCGSTANDLQVSIAGCTDANPACIFNTGQKASIKATFTSPVTIESAEIKITASVGIASLNFPLSPAEACGNWGLKCPAPAGSPQALMVEVPIDSSYPKIKVGVELQLVTSQGEKLICKSFPVEIK